MNNRKIITKEDVIDALKRTVYEKRKVQSFLKGEITKEDLEKEGIKLVKPF